MPGEFALQRPPNNTSETERAWWRKNRDSQAVFEIALEQTLARIAAHPYSGIACRRPAVKGLRQTNVSKINCHLYYTADGDTVTVRALWGARRRHGPRI